jgi:hypothetical protein
MNVKQAKRLRKKMYSEQGKDFRDRKYSTLSNGQVVSDPDRQKYQQAKKLCSQFHKEIFK